MKEVITQGKAARGGLDCIFLFFVLFFFVFFSTLKQKAKNPFVKKVQRM